MENLIKAFEKVYIKSTAKNSKVAQRIESLFSKDKIEICEELPSEYSFKTLSAKEFSRSKKILLVEEFKGQFFKRCPGARPGLTCCNYFVLNLGLQCNMNCSYCYLQSFINTPMTTVYSNIENALAELKVIGESVKDQPLRVGTGEVIDSLSLDPLTLYSNQLIEFFADYPRWRLEFKTKSDSVDQFVNVPHKGNVVVSWSINPPQVIDSEEHGTAKFADRLAAAKKCRDKGFLISFHIDPMIWHPDWKPNYAFLVDEIIRQFSPEDIPYMSVGALRFQPEQRHMMRERFGMTGWVTSAEVFKSSDGKLRYDKDLRQEMMNFVVSRFKKANSKWNIFLCMETPETWLGSMDSLPKSAGGLDELFDHRVTRKTTLAQTRPS